MYVQLFMFDLHEIFTLIFRGDPLSNPSKGQWFKFNDTSVAQVEMNDTLLEQECFGGTYKAKVSYDSCEYLSDVFNHVIFQIYAHIYCQ